MGNQNWDGFEQPKVRNQPCSHGEKHMEQQWASIGPKSSHQFRVAKKYQTHTPQHSIKATISCSCCKLCNAFCFHFKLPHYIVSFFLFWPWDRPSWLYSCGKKNLVNIDSVTSYWFLVKYLSSKKKKKFILPICFPNFFEFTSTV